MSLTETRKQARKLLDLNRHEVEVKDKTYSYIVPSKDYYVHHWNWDAVTHAMGLVHTKDKQLAFNELEVLLSRQWENGLVSHVRFDPDKQKYFPNIQFWKTGGATRKGVHTSGITNPPLLAVGANYIYQQLKSEDYAKDKIQEIVEGVIKYHEHLKEYRDPDDSGLLSIIHPWESGADNSPRWDNTLNKISLNEIPAKVKKTIAEHRSDHKLGKVGHRPRAEDYYRYMYLIWFFRKKRWNHKKIVKESPFLVKDVFFNSIWVLANESLATLLLELDREEEAKKYASWANQTRVALGETWDEGFGGFLDIDVSGEEPQPIKENTFAQFMPMLAGAASESQVQKLISKLCDEDQFWTKYPIPSTSISSEKFEIARYWRGSTWPIVNMFFIEAMGRYAHIGQCLDVRDELVKKTLEMIDKYGFYEYFSPMDPPEKLEEEAFGFSGFSWTAAVFLYLYNEYHLKKENQESAKGLDLSQLSLSK